MQKTKNTQQKICTPNINGCFIILEGTDGSGKATQTKLLTNRLKKEGYAVEQISFPQYGKPSATMIEAYLRGELGTAEEVGPYRASIFYAIDRYAASTKVQSWLDTGKIVIANRYVGSNMGHQGGKITDQNERQKYFDWNYHLEYTIFGIPKPTINIILHIPAAIGQSLVDKKNAREYLHGKTRDIHENNIQHLLHAEASYLDMAKRYPEYNIIECTTKKNILPINTIHQYIWNYIKTRLHLLIL